MSRPGAIRSRIVALLAAALTVAIAIPARAQFGSDAYTPVTVAPTGFMTQFGGAVSDGSGGILVTWVDTRAGLSHVYVQRLTGTGAVFAGWPAGGLQVCANAAGEYTPTLLGDGAGGAYVAWSDVRGTTRDIYLTRVTGGATYATGFNSNGLLVSTSGVSAIKDEYSPTMTPDGAGGAFVVWTLQYGTSDQDIYGAHVTAAGALAWSNGLYTPVGIQNFPKALPDGSGGFFLGWSDNDNGSLQHQKVARFNSSGGTVWGPLYIGTGSGFNQYGFDIAPDNSGGVYAVCADNGPVSYTNLSGNHFLANGTNDPTWGGYKFLVPEQNVNQSGPLAMNDGSGGLFLAFDDFRYGSPDLFAQRFGPYALPYAGWPAGGVALAVAPVNQLPETMVSDGTGGAVIAFLDDRLGLDYLLYAVRVLGNGNIAPGWAYGGNPVDMGGLIDSGSQAPATVADGSAGALFAWGDMRGSTPWSGYAGIYAQNLDQFGALGDARPRITSIADVPNDNGGQVSLQWSASYLDADPSRTVTQYTIWRRVPGGVAAAAARAALERADVPGSGPAAARPAWRATRDGAQVVYWGYVATQQALMLPGYSAVVPTTSDSMSTGNPKTSLMVVAESAGGMEFWQSAPDSGYSVDNLAPYPPAPFAGTYSGGVASLHWAPDAVPDLAGYRLYRSTIASFVPAPSNRIATPADTVYSDAAGAPYYYRLTAVDVHGNESASTLLLPAGALAVDGSSLPRELALAPPAPNPARGPTTLGYALPRDASVRLTLYDVSGRRVRGLVDAAQPAGAHEAAWNLTDDRGHAVGAGLYLARLEVEGRVLVRRVMVLH